MKKVISLIVFVLAMSVSAAAQEVVSTLEKIREIKLLESSRDDVRRIFVGYEFKNYNISDYREWIKTKGIEIEFAYSEGNCKNKEDDDDYDVSEWKVSYIQISLHKPIELKELEKVLEGFGAKISAYRREKLYINDDDIYVRHNKVLGIGLEVVKDSVREIFFIAPRKYYPLICDKKIAKRRLSTKSFFTLPIKERKLITDERGFLGVGYLELSGVHLTADCVQANTVENYTCPDDGGGLIEVKAESNYPTDYSFVFQYETSGGKIIGTGKKVVWDLSGAKPGTYIITARIDDGCGICGPTVTKTVTIAECPNCIKNAGL